MTEIIIADSLLKLFRQIKDRMLSSIPKITLIKIKIGKSLYFH